MKLQIKRLRVLLMSRHGSLFILGTCIGIALSLISTPFFQKDCKNSAHFTWTSDSMLGNLRDLRSQADEIEDEYEPRWHLNHKESLIENDDSIKKLFRPRYYSSELGIKNKTFVAVISTKESVASFGIAINKTLNAYVNKLVFFMDDVSDRKLKLRISTVGFKDSKPLIMIFRVLSYIFDKFYEDYDLFYFISDHTYVNGQGLMEMVKRLSVGRNIHMGINVDKDSYYCSLENGILLGQKLIGLVGQHLEWCTRNSHSDSVSDNLGRCILHATNIPCSSYMQGQVYRSYTVKEDHMSDYLKRDIQFLSNSITVPHLENPQSIYSLYMYFLLREANELKNKIVKSRLEEIPNNKSLETIAWPYGSPIPHRPATRFDVITWESLNSTHIFPASDNINAHPYNSVDEQDIQHVLSSAVKHISEINSDLIFNCFKFGHRRFDPTRGMDYVLSVNFKHKTTGKLFNKLIEGSRLLTFANIMPMPYVTENNRVNIIVVVAHDELKDAMQFLDRFESDVTNHEFSVIFVLLYATLQMQKQDHYMSLKQRSSSFSKKHSKKGWKVSWVVMSSLYYQPSQFSIIDIATHSLQPDSLLLYTTLRAHLSTEFLNRVKMNTIVHTQVFSVIPFVFYHPDLITKSLKASYDKMDVNRNNGKFDQLNFNHISFYLDDYLHFRKALSAEIRSEKDLTKYRPKKTLHQMFLSMPHTSAVKIMRAAEPGLKVPYADVLCDLPKSEDKPQNLSEYVSLQEKLCLKRQSTSLGLRSVLSKLVINNAEE